MVTEAIDNMSRCADKLRSIRKTVHKDIHDTADMHKLHICTNYRYTQCTAMTTADTLTLELCIHMVDTSKRRQPNTRTRQKHTQAQTPHKEISRYDADDCAYSR
eukprot:GHVQ01037504.1.p1 GENE.GHVQ01037504.1~~GHVQ01037504.1.p1  ORF type:complete len:104 (+),score=12.89 GHVQ01037504.1:239-550(+)